MCFFAFKRALFPTGVCGRLFWIRWEDLPIHDQLGLASERTWTLLLGGVGAEKAR